MASWREPTTTWLPTTADIIVATERAALAALDANLLLAIRCLRAQYGGCNLDHPCPRDPALSQYDPPQLPLVLDIISAAIYLHGLVANYRRTLRRVLGDTQPRHNAQQPPGDLEPEDDDSLF